MFKNGSTQRTQRKEDAKIKMEDELSNRIIGAAITVHKVLGPGLLESVYEEALCHELSLQKMSCQRQVIVPVFYKNVEIKEPFFLDILVEERVIVEVKSSEKEHPIHKAQLLSYLRLTEKKLGLLINFGRACLKDGICRIANGL